MAGRETSEKQVFGITVAIVAVVLVVVAVFTALSYRNLSKLKTERERLLKLADDHQKIISTKAKVQTELEEAEARFANTRKYLPDAKDVDGLLDAFGSKCIDSKLDFSKLDRAGSASAAPKRGAERKDVEEIQFKGEFSGTFHSLAKFVSMLEDWEHFKRFVSITQFSMAACDKGQAYDTGAQRHDISMTLELYKYEEPKAPTPKAGPKVPGAPGAAPKPQ